MHCLMPPVAAPPDHASRRPTDTVGPADTTRHLVQKDETDCWVDVADRTETLFEPSYIDYMTYGYIAARDEYDLKLNYVFSRGREDPVVVQEASLIQMTGPKRGIAFHCNGILEFDLRIKNGEKEEDDAQLIDGMSEFREMLMLWEPTPDRIEVDCGAVEVSSALVSNAAIVEVIVVSEVRSGFDLSLCSTISAMEPHEFQLFHDSLGEWCGRRRFVIAVTLDTMMHLKFVVGPKGPGGKIKCKYSFRANKK
ncbi:hypothetical protein ZWY2020_002229 [Hordeum vulgare]|nr:hypothetical protein ZWY2020_002229 [Hordeum vulgare]